MNRVEVVLRHTRLANEYATLSQSSHSLSLEEWEKIIARQNEIVEEINEIKSIEASWRLSPDHV